MKFTEYNAFGWRVDKYEMQDGEKYKAVVAEDISKESLANLTFYVAGNLIPKTSNGFKLEAKYPGFFNDNLPDVLPAMDVEFTAVGNVEWWCTNWILNKGKLPKLSKIVLKQNDIISLVYNDKILVCKGLLKSGLSEFNSESVINVTSENVQLLALTDTYCLKFED